MSDFDININKLSSWLDKNIISVGNNLFHNLKKAGLVRYEDIENLYEYNDIDDQDDEDYEEYKIKYIYTWYIITEEAYEKFKKIGLCVLKINELCLFGRTIYGQPIIDDFYYMREETNVILDL